MLGVGSDVDRGAEVDRDECGVVKESKKSLETARWMICDGKQSSLVSWADLGQRCPDNQDCIASPIVNYVLCPWTVPANPRPLYSIYMFLNEKVGDKYSVTHLVMKIFFRYLLYNTVTRSKHRSANKGIYGTANISHMAP